MHSVLRRSLLSVAILAMCGCGPGSDDPPASSDDLNDRVSAAQGAGRTKVVVCHIPPGNPANAHTITIGAPAVPAHLAHGDVLGLCPTPPPPPPPPGPTAPGAGQVKVDICHIPPGNPANAHTITVGAPAVPAHLAHGDLAGVCPGVALDAGVPGDPTTPG
jgi:hypothetical protein